MTYTTEWIGLEKEIEDSLKNKGIICKNERSDEYFCLYKKDNNFYDYSFLYESEVIELLEGKSWLSKIQVNTFLNFCGLSLEDFLKLNFVYKLYSLIQYFGIEDIMGKSFNDFSFQEVFRLTDDSRDIIPFVQ